MDVKYLMFGFLLGLMTNLPFMNKVGNYFLQKVSEVKKYFGSPCDEKFDLNWSTRQFFRIFSKPMSERWYESRAHLRAGIWTSLACTFGLVTLVSADFMYDHDDSRGISEKLCYGFWVLPGNHKERMLELIAEAGEIGEGISKKDQPVSLYQIFIAGENVVWDWMNGDLRTAWEERTSATF